MGEEIQVTENAEGESNQDAVNEIISDMSGKSIEEVEQHESEDTSDKVEEEAFDREVEKGANRKAREASAEESEPRERKERETYSGSDRRMPPTSQQNPQQLEQQYYELENAIGQLNELASTNQISPQQYQQAVYNAQNMQNQIKQQHLDNEYQQMQTYKQNERKLDGFNKEISEAIPDWGDTTKRNNIQEGMKNWAFNKYGITAEQVTQWGRTATPVDIKMYYDAYKADQPVRKKPRRRSGSKKIHTKEPDYKYHSGIEAQSDAIAELLLEIGIS